MAKRNIAGQKTEVTRKGEAEYKREIAMLEEQAVVQIAVGDVSTRPPFSEVFPVEDERYGALVASMRTTGFDKNIPIILWKREGNAGVENVVVDGHRRLSAAKEAGLSFIYARFDTFDSVEDAVAHMYRYQFARRNLKEIDLIRFIREAGKRPDALQRSAMILYPDQFQDGKGRFREKVARVYGTSATKVQRAQYIIENAADEQISLIEESVATINSLYDELRGQTKGDPAMNRPAPEASNSGADDDSGIAPASPQPVDGRSVNASPSVGGGVSSGDADSAAPSDNASDDSLSGGVDLVVEYQADSDDDAERAGSEFDGEAVRGGVGVDTFYAAFAELRAVEDESSLNDGQIARCIGVFAEHGILSDRDAADLSRRLLIDLYE